MYKVVFKQMGAYTCLYTMHNPDAFTPILYRGGVNCTTKQKGDNLMTLGGYPGRADATSGFYSYGLVTQY